ncbi:MAG TPA: glucohydrolase, partial [Erysipelotrichaceae bacterium]|nr:glucohydrolase [Erysipelotrichaceae bacterium]
MKQHYQSVIYQIWPRSFKDSQNDGIGDLQGIISKLDYLASLGIDYLWLSPIYASPNADYGYDVSDYYQIHPDFGTMADFDTLLFEANRRGIKLIMDIVANHTSIEHTWFQSALKDVSSPYRDFYYFKEGKGNYPPNNWISIFGGSAWRPIEDNTYALALFTPSQVDLNWQNPKVRNEVVRILKFWLDKGVAGFRWDVINTISKIDGLIDKNPNKKGLQFADDYIINRDPSLQYIDEIMSQLSDYPDALMIGEGMLIDQASAAKYAPNQLRRMDMMFHFDLHMLGCGPLGKYDFRKLYRFSTMDMKKVIFSWQKDMQDKGYWIGNYLSNHDQPRQISRFGDDKTYRVESGKALAVLNFTLSGTPLVYQGEEIGM